MVLLYNVKRGLIAYSDVDIYFVVMGNSYIDSAFHEHIFMKYTIL